MLSDKLRSVPVAARLTYITQTSSLSKLTTYTFTGVSIGTASDDRLVVIACAAGRSSAENTLSSVTIGGTAATVHAASPSVVSGAATIQCGIASRLVTSGTTADIVITWSAQVDACNLAVYTLTAWKSSTPTSTFSATTVTSVTTRTATINLSARGATLFVVGPTGSGRTTTWSSATENYDGSPDARATMAVANILPLNDTASFVETATTSTSGTISIAAVSWR
jgi:hypothetical protein